MNSKICQMVADSIVESLNEGIVPWRKPWVGGAIDALVDGLKFDIQRHSFSQEIFQKNFLLGVP